MKHEPMALRGIFGLKTGSFYFGDNNCMVMPTEFLSLSWGQSSVEPRWDSTTDTMYRVNLDRLIGINLDIKSC